jgi:hypothetical protein
VSDDVDTVTPASEVSGASAPSALRCPIDHTAVAPGCPVRHTDPSQRSRADHIARRVLRVPEAPEGFTSQGAYSAFQRSMAISATRCLLTYVVFPFVLPAVGFATGVGPIIGIIIGVTALVCDVFAIRRFFAVDHRWRWHFTAVAACIMTLLMVLLVQDVMHLVT